MQYRLRLAGSLMVMPALLAFGQLVFFLLCPNWMQLYVYGQCIVPILVLPAAFVFPEDEKTSHVRRKMCMLAVASALLSPFVTWNLLSLVRNVHLNVCACLWAYATVLCHVAWGEVLHVTLPKSCICRLSCWMWNIGLIMCIAVGLSWTYLSYSAGADILEIFDFMLFPGGIQHCVLGLLALGFLFEAFASVFFTVRVCSLEEL